MERYTSLRDVRYKNGDLTQSEMSKKIGISESSYNMLETGKRYGSTRTWRKIQEIFGLTDAEVWRMQNQKK